MRPPLLLLAVLVILLGLSQSAMGHPNHSAPIDSDQAIMAAESGLKAMVRAKMKVDGQPLDGSWLDIKPEHRTLYRQGAGYYIVSIANPAQNKAIYLLLSDTGMLYSANFIGTFKGIDY